MRLQILISTGKFKGIVLTLTNPVVHPQPRNTPENDDIPASEDLTSNYERGDHNCNTNIREHDQWQLVLLVEDAVLAKVEMGDSWPLGTVIPLSGQVEEQISRPSKQLVDNIVPQSGNWGVLSKFGELDQVCVGLRSEIGLHPRISGVWHECSVLLDVASRLVVLGVGQAP